MTPNREGYGTLKFNTQVKVEKREVTMGEVPSGYMGPNLLKDTSSQTNEYCLRSP